MNTTITNFTNEYIRFGNGLVSSTITVVNAYIAYNNGSTAGKLKLYAHLQGLDGVSKVRSEFYGMELVQPTQPVAQPVAQPVVEPTQPAVAQSVVEPTMSEYEMKCLELKERKIEQARELEEIRIEETRKLKERKYEEARKLKERELEHQTEIEQMKMRFKSDCFERTMSFQQEVNNQNRYLTAGFVNRKTEYIALGTASNVHIEYDSAIDNLNELGFNNSVKEPIEKCFKDQVVDIKMVDEKMEKAIPLSTMINIHHFIISKLDTNELSEGIKQKIVEEYEKEEYTEVKNIINDLDVSLDDAKRQIQILTTEIMRLREIEAEARLYSRVHTKSYNRCLSENKKMMDKIGRKSMLSPQEYVVPENNIRFDKQYNQIVDCYCCGTAIDIKDAHRSHIVAKELGGSCDKENIRICCKKCNLGMSIMDLEEYKASLK